jgi:hypothetical protein
MKPFIEESWCPAEDLNHAKLGALSVDHIQMSMIKLLC